MSQFPSEAIQAALAEVEADEKEMVELSANMLMAHGGTVYGLNFDINYDTKHRNEE